MVVVFAQILQKLENPEDNLLLVDLVLVFVIVFEFFVSCFNKVDVMQMCLIEVKLCVIGGALYIMDMVDFFFVDEQIPVDARHFAHQVECLASVVTIGVLLYDLLLVNRVEVVVDDVLQLEHEVILILLRIQFVEFILRFRVAAQQQRTAQQQRFSDDFRVVLDRDELDHHLHRSQFNQHVLRVTHFCFNV